MALFGLHAPTFGPLHPIIGKLNASTGLTGFTNTYVPFGNAAGGLDESSNFTWNGTNLGITGDITATNKIGASIFKTNNYRNADETKSIIYNSGTSRWYVSYNLGVSGNLEASGTLTLPSMSIAGFVKNNASGVLSGGNTISISDITDIANTYLKLDCSNGPLTGTATWENISGNLLQENGDTILLESGDALILEGDSGSTTTEISYTGITTDGIVEGGTGKFGDVYGGDYVNIDADGHITLEGDARVYKNQWITVNGLKAPGTKPATLVDWGISCGYEFTNGTDDTICTTIRIPQDMDKTVAPEFKIGFVSDTNTGDVVWQLEYLYVSPNEDTTAAAQGTLTTTQTISSTADGLTIATITGMDLLSATDQLLKLRIKRLGADASDTLADDCVFTGCGFKYVADKLGMAI